MSQPEPPAADQSESASAGGVHEPQPLPLDLVSPQLTLRAILTGMLLGGLLSICNVYASLKVGWSINMSVTAALLGYGLWTGLRGLSGKRVRHFGILENNINQTACSSGAMVSSAGLVAPIPALAMLTGQTLPWHYLALWVFSVCLVGITVAIALRRQMLLVDKLPFPIGIASAETLREIYARGKEAIARVTALGCSAAVASVMALVIESGRLSIWGPSFLIRGFKAKSLTFALDPSLLMVGIGGLIGFRACCSLMIGAIIAWGIVAPPLIRSGNIRLTVAEPLPALPPGVELPPEPQGHAEYDENRRRLKWKGVMTAAERDELLSLSDAPLYQEAILKLHLRSLSPLLVPLAELPPHVDLTGTPVAYDTRAKALTCIGGIDRDMYAALRAQSLAPAYREAVDALYAHLDYTTTRPLQSSEPLGRFPKRLWIVAREYPIPREYAGMVRYDAEREVLVAFGPMTTACREDLQRQATEMEVQSPDEAAVTALQAFRATLDRLYAKSNRVLWPAGAAIPEELTAVVRYDEQAQTLQATGMLTGSDEEALLALSDDPDFQKTVKTLVADSAFRRAEPDYGDLIKWMLWPGVTLMVIAALTSFAFSWRSVLAAIPGRRPANGDAQPTSAETGEVARRWFVTGLIVALILSVALQVSFFEIVWWAAIIGVLLSFALALVAARVSGETGITPVGAMGKVTQLVFGALVPRNPAPNLMAANVTGGAAAQCADLLHDMKCGYLLGASPRLQSLAQVCGAFAGAMVGSAAYLILIPNPAEQLITDTFPAPAVAAWKAVAELFMVGFEAIPAGTGQAMLIAAVVAVALTVLEKLSPSKARRFLPSPASLGLAFVVSAHNSISMFIGGLIALCLSRWYPSWSKRFLVAICAGLIVGQSLTDVGAALWYILTG
ncbi:MAG TPA: OPT/YSL family transporter [Phycisphaerae bacterium]|nr:OPT/YSL family transporter [Phycisphaerae bacterium]